jgi:hypothetical protein
MTIRYEPIPVFSALATSRSGGYVDHQDYNKLVEAVREVILDFDHSGEHSSIKRRLENLLVDLGEEI